MTYYLYTAEVQKLEDRPIFPVLRVWKGRTLIWEQNEPSPQATKSAASSLPLSEEKPTGP